MQRAITQLLLVSLALMKRMVRQFQMDAGAIGKEHRAEAGAERDHQLKPMAGHATETLDIGIVSDAHRLLELAFQRVAEVEAVPSIAEIRGCIDHAVFDHAGKSHRYALKRRLILRQLARDLD